MNQVINIIHATLHIKGLQAVAVPVVLKHRSRLPLKHLKAPHYRQIASPSTDAARTLPPLEDSLHRRLAQLQASHIHLSVHLLS